MSQLSTGDDYNDDDEEDYSTSCNKKRPWSTSSTPDIILKKIRLWDDNHEDQNDEIPVYLQSTDKIFHQILANHRMNSSVTTITTEDLRQLAILKHKMAVINIDKELWTIYFKSGTGQWERQTSGKTSVDRRIWSMPVKKMMSDAIDISQGEDEQKIYETIVHQYLEEFVMQNYFLSNFSFPWLFPMLKGGK